MHASHEQDAASGNALYGSNLTSDLTLSVGTGSSGEYSSKASDLPTPTREPSSSDYNSEVDESKLFGESLTSTSSAEYESELGHSPCDSRKTLNQAIATPTISKTVGFPNLCYKQDCVAISAEEGCPCDTVGTSEQGLLLFAESLRSNPDRWRSDVQHNFSTCSDRVLLNPYNGRENIGNKKDNQMLAAKPTVSDIEAKIERIRASPSQTTQSFEVNAAGNSACNVRAQAKAFPERLTEEENEGRLSSTPKQMQFKYEDLKSLSQHGKSHRTSTSYDSDDVEEYDVFKGVEHTHSCSPPPPPPPPVSREVPSGTLVGEQTALKAVSSDITGSLLFSDQSSLNIDEKECLRAVQSDVTSSLLAGEKTISLQHQVLNSSEEEGISVTLMEESEKKNDVDIMKKDTKKEVKATTEILERSESIVGSHVMMNSPEALMKLGMSFMENLYSGMCNANGKPEKNVRRVAND